MKIEIAQRSSVIFGFDSAWTDSPKSLGAICAITFDDVGNIYFHEPKLASFAEALAFIDEFSRDFSLSLVAIDQPTIVPNLVGSRPVDKVAAALVSYVGGGVQPANRGKLGMFCDNSPIWTFLTKLRATEDPAEARSAQTGRFIIEVFPALALPSLDERFALRLGGPKYNPRNRRKFRLDDWLSVTQVILAAAEALEIEGLVQWANRMGSLSCPRKSDQDKLDSCICALIGLIWRAGPHTACIMMGDTTTGYMITPVSESTRPRLEQAAALRGVPIYSPTSLRKYAASNNLRRQ